MLPPFIIEQIRKREEEQHRQQQQPALELPLPRRRDEKRRDRVEDVDDRIERGVVIIDLKRD
jgi:hypothetical protein